MKKIILSNVVVLVIILGVSLTLFGQGLFAQEITTGDATSITIICNDVNNNTGEGSCITPSPSPSPSPEPEPTLSPSPEPEPSPSPSPESSPAGGGTQEVSGAATTEGQVLGAMAGTGTAIEDLFLMMFTLGSSLVATGLKLYAKKN